MTRSILILALITSSALFAQAPAREDPARAALVKLLGVIDSPVAKADLDRVAEGRAAELLRSIALDTSAQTLHRQRAAHALGGYASADSRAVLLQLATDPQATLRKTAVARLAAYPNDAPALSALQVALEDREVSIRKLAIKSLAGVSAARPALERRLAVETDRNAKALLVGALKR